MADPRPRRPVAPLHIATTEHAPWRTQRTPAVSPRPADASTDLADTGATDQTIRGFGGCFNELGWDALALLSAARRRAVLESLFGEDGCRFTFCRVPIGASDYARSWYSLDETPGDYRLRHFSIQRDRQALIPYIRAAQQIRPELELFASPWSPPTWMKTPPVYNYGVIRWEPQVLAAYARYLRRFVESYARAGIRVVQVHVQNEPISDQKFPSCVWTGHRLRDFIAHYLGPEFRRHRTPAEIWLGTLNGPETDARWPWTRYNDYANLVLSDPAAAQYISGVSYQWGGRMAVQRTRASWPDIPLIQSENECGDGTNSWTYAHYVFDLIWHYLTNGVVAYVYWNMVLQTGGRSTWGWPQNSLVTVDPQTRRPAWHHEYYLMKHLSRWVRPGAVRRILRGPWTGNALCFRNPDGTHALVVCNPFPDHRRIVADIGTHRVSALLPPSSFNTVVLPPDVPHR